TVLLRLLFFQAEDGIRVDLVTGVQTCALPIYAVGVPEVLGWDDATLVVSQVPPGRADAAAAERLGRELARLHGAGASRFGAPWPGFIASLFLPNDQPTPASAAGGPGSWPDWYRACRVQPYLRLAVAAG